MKYDLDAATRKLADERQFSKRTAAQAAGVSERWVYKYLNGETENPSMTHVQRLHDYLLTARKRR